MSERDKMIERALKFATETEWQSKSWAELMADFALFETPAIKKAAVDEFLGQLRVAVQMGYFKASDLIAIYAVFNRVYAEMFGKEGE